MTLSAIMRYRASYDLHNLHMLIGVRSKRPRDVQALQDISERSGARTEDQMGKRNYFHVTSISL